MIKSISSSVNLFFHEINEFRGLNPKSWILNQSSYNYAGVYCTSRYHLEQLFFNFFFRNLKNNPTCLQNVSKARKETYSTQVTRVGLGGKWPCSILGTWRESIYWFLPGYNLSRLTPIRHVQQVCNINTGQTDLRLQRTRSIPKKIEKIEKIEKIVICCYCTQFVQ